MLKALVDNPVNMVVCQRIEHRLSVPATLDKLRLLENPKLMRNRRLRHIKQLCNVADTHLRLKQHKQNPDPRRITKYLKTAPPDHTNHRHPAAFPGPTAQPHREQHTPHSTLHHELPSDFSLHATRFCPVSLLLSWKQFAGFYQDFFEIFLFIWIIVHMFIIWM